MPTIICSLKECNNTRHVPPCYYNGKDGNNYCCIEHYREDIKSKVELECSNCGIEFERKKSNVKTDNPCCSIKCTDELKLLYPKTKHLRKIIHKRRSNKRDSEQLSDNYVKSVIISGSELQSYKDIPQKHIEAKRLQLAILRQIKQSNK